MMNKYQIRLILVSLIIYLSPIVGFATTVSQYPLFLLNQVDPNVLFNMSVETPMGGAAYNDQADGDTCSGRVNDGGTVGVCYDKAKTYLGYFDPDKCYVYDTGNTRFNPSDDTNAYHECSGKFSGNMLNWATMTAMDMFVWTMTGGNRVDDGADNLTVIRRAQKQNHDGWFPHKLLTASLNVAPSTVTPWSDTKVYIYNTDFGVRFGTSHGGNQLSAGDYDVEIRVCNKNKTLEDNCVPYDNGSYYKPEGLIQKNAENMRFAVTSYSNTNGNGVDGGVLRSNMKYVGTNRPDGSGNLIANTHAEINADGTFNTNPNPADATASNVSYSGVITYLNKFSDDGYKENDPASELFYESIRYFKNLGPTSEYLNGSSGRFPKIGSSDWEDPIQYRCQSNFIVGMNDANPWKDKRLPGTFFSCSSFNGEGISDDCGVPSSPDTDINVTSLTNKVGELEGLNGTSQYVGCTAVSCDMSNNLKNIPGLGEVFGTYPYPPKENSYYIAGLAYYANTEDIRDDLDGDQHVKTFMIDSQEYSPSPLTGPMNMLWLAGKYGGFTDENGDKDPNNGKKPNHDSPAVSSKSTSTSEWDADKDHEPDNYVLASSPEKLVKGLKDAFSTVIEGSSSASAVATNSTRIDLGFRVYRGSFNGIDWSGDLSAYALDENGKESSVSDWKASEKIPEAANRKIYTYDTEQPAGIDFEYNNLNLEQRNYLNVDIFGVIDDEAELRVNYLRGDDANEGEGTDKYRVRSSLLGDIVHSDPWYQATTGNFGYGVLLGAEGSSYPNFRSVKLGTTPTIYVGANDGMLHAVKADDGTELFAYVPNAVFPNLYKLTSTLYGCNGNRCIGHQYFVDGSPVSADAYFDSQWHTVLVGTLGAGGKGIFALDVTDPLNFDRTKVLWEFTNSYTPVTDDLNKDYDVANNLGYTLSQASIVRVNYKEPGGIVGKWVAIVSNGYDSANNKAVIYVIEINTGKVLAEFDTEVGSAAAPNGMSSPTVVDFNDDKIADAIYAGDLQGNLWKIDLTASKWGFAFSQGGKPVPLFVAKDKLGVVQPITSEPESTRYSRSGRMVFFGTGKYFENVDRFIGESPQVQTFYGIKDQGAVISSRDDLQEQTILYEDRMKLIKVEDDPNTPDIDESETVTKDIRITSNNSVALAKKGWYLDLKSPDAAGGAKGERVIYKPLLRPGRVVFTTIIPTDDPCTDGGTGWPWELSAESGSRLEQSPFDVNGDGLIDEKDYVSVDLDNDGNYELIPVSSFKGEDGAMLGRVTHAINPDPDADVAEKKFIGTVKNTMLIIGESGDNVVGRQSWRQLR